MVRGQREGEGRYGWGGGGELLGCVLDGIWVWGRENVGVGIYGGGGEGGITFG